MYVSIVIRRFIELCISEMLLSLIFALLFTFIFPSYAWLIIFMSVIMLSGYLALNAVMLRRMYKFLNDNYAYLAINLSLNVSFGILNLILYLVSGKYVYTWLFGIFKVLYYMDLSGIILSAAVMQLVLFLLVFAAPFAAKPEKHVIQ